MVDASIGDYSDSSYKAMPPIPQDLVEALDARFPARCPRIHESDRDIWTYVGNRAVVEWLMAVRKRQQERPLI